MGYYLNHPDCPSKKKAQFYIERGEATLGEPTFVDPATGEVTVCVVDNGVFEAAGIGYSEREIEDFDHELDTRPKIWLRVPVAVADRDCKGWR